MFMKYKIKLILLESEDQIDPLSSHPQQKIVKDTIKEWKETRATIGNTLTGCQWSLRRGALLGPLVVALGTLVWFCLVQQVSAVRLLTTPGLQSWAPCCRHPGENAFSSLHVFFAPLLLSAGWDAYLVRVGAKTATWCSTGSKRPLVDKLRYYRTS